MNNHCELLSYVIEVCFSYIHLCDCNSICLSSRLLIILTLKPYKRDQKGRTEEAFSIGFVRCESHFELHSNFYSSKIVCLIQTWTIIAMCILRILRNLEDEVEILLNYKHTSRMDRNNPWLTFLISYNSLGNTRHPMNAFKRL